MRFTLFTFAAVIATKSNAIQSEYDEDELSNEALFPQVASYLNSMSDEELDQLENYMAQIHAEDAGVSDGDIFAQLETEEENDLAVVANYLAQLSSEEMFELADHSAQQNVDAFAQTMSDSGMGEMWENMQEMAPTFAQVFARELQEESGDWI